MLSLPIIGNALNSAGMGVPLYLWKKLGYGRKKKVGRPKKK